MRIGIDIDGVLTDEHSFIIDFASKYLNERNIPYTVHKDIYDSEKVFDVSKEVWREFWKEHIFYYSKNVQARPFASEVINKLKKENIEIFIITARYYTTYENEHTEEMQKIVKEWLNNNNIPYDKIIFSEEKVDICKKYEIDLMIEDKPENILSISNEIPVICYDHLYNAKLNNKNIIRCYSWYDIYEKLLEFIKR